MSLRVGSLFSGIGGLELGLERAGMRVLWQVENSDFCRRVLAKHWPDVRRYEDVHDVGAHNLEPVDLICGGFPCQPVSVAGKRKGQDDERWLWPEFARIIRELRPRYALMENVPGLLVRGFGDVLGDLAALGYDAEWSGFCADWFGVPQSRPRIFIVAARSPASTQPLFHPNALNALRDRSWLDVACGGASNIDDEDYRASAVPVLGNGDGAAIPYRERGGYDGGIPFRLDRLRALGNAVVPQVAEYIGRRIMSAT